MLIYKKGDLLEATENVICHQVNEDGFMGGGIALAIARKYPGVEEKYRNYCEQYERTSLYGKCLLVKYDEDKYIANCFSQIDFVTSINDIEKIFNMLVKHCKENNLTIAIPYKYGCGIASGNWEEVSKTIKKVADKYRTDIVVYQLENED